MLWACAHPHVDKADNECEKEKNEKEKGKRNEDL